MLKTDRNFDLTLDPDVAYRIAELVQTYQGEAFVPLEDEDEIDSDPGDDLIPDVDALADEAERPHHDVLEDELEGLISGLNVDARHDLLALIWVGRGDFEASDWASARRAAREAEPFSVSDYIEELQSGGDYIEEALSALGYAPPEDHE
ncbi:MAG: DUF3775 domain-containing protein [Hyphomonas sp.]|uniref:DUF3775 domain-containing protein n=1 Tax=Hyphomonas sp. TaxID=87 RepID=UPI003528DEDB